MRRKSEDDTTPLTRGSEGTYIAPEKTNLWQQGTAVNTDHCFLTTQIVLPYPLCLHHTIAMTIREFSSIEDIAAYDRWLRGHIDGTLWQSLEWKAFQEQRNRKTRLFVLDDGRILGSALAVIDQTSLGLCTWDIPRGPLIADKGVRQRDVQDFLAHLRGAAKHDGCYALYFSPCHAFEALLDPKNKKRSARHEQPEATIMIDLRPSEEDILAQMHQKGRYNIKVAQKNGVTVEQSAHVGAFYKLIQETAERDGFRPPSLEHYRLFLRTIPDSFLLLAYVSGQQEPIAGLIGAVWNGRGIYYYGASSQTHRNLMAPSLLQWEAMLLCKKQKCTSYDLFGIAPPDAESHYLSGVTDFKRKFGGTVIHYPPEHRLLLRPLAARLLAAKRKIMG